MADFAAGDVIRTRLQAVAGVTALVGAAPNDRIYRGMVPQKPDPIYPVIVLRRVPNASARLKGVYSDPGYAKVPVQVICLGDTQDQADQVAEQVRLAIERFGSGQPAGTPFAGVTLYDIVMGAEAEGYVEEIEKFFTATDWTVEFLEATP